MTTVFLMRHGMTVGGEEKRYKGHIDVPLSDEGIKGVIQMAEYLKSKVLSSEILNKKPVKIYSSDLVRAQKTAQLIGEKLLGEPETISEFRERHFGNWEGMTFEEIAKEYPGDFKAWAQNPLEFSPLGGESTISVSNRAMPVFYKLLSRDVNSLIVIVAHGGINRVMLCNILNTSLENIFKIEQDFACLNEIEFYNETPVIKTLNYTV